MSTRSLIGLKRGGKVQYVYCHFDGYFEHNGVILYECYNTEEKVKELIKQDLFGLEKNIKDIDFIALSETKNIGANKEDIMQAMEAYGAEYFYIFDDKKWGFYERFGEKKGELRSSKEAYEEYQRKQEQITTNMKHY